MSNLSQGLEGTARALARATNWLGAHALDAYRAVDPDVARHIVQLPLLSYALFARRNVAVAHIQDDGYHPLVLVHGLGGNRGAFLPMVTYLRMQGRRRIYSIDLRGEASLETMAKALTRFIIEVLQVSQAAKFDLVAHSAGGIVARLAMRNRRLGQCCETFITLGTPHRGTYPARYANTRVTKALRPDSELIRELAEEPLPEGVRGVSLWSRNDLFVLPAESAALEGTEQIDVSPATHYSYLVQPTCWAIVHRHASRRVRLS